MQLIESSPDKPVGSVVAKFSWQPPRRWCQGVNRLQPLEGTLDGSISFHAEDAVLWAECRWPLPRPWTELWGENRAQAMHGHGLQITALAHILAVVAGAPTLISEMYYESVGCCTWHSTSISTTRTLWDFGGFPGDLVREAELASALAHVPAASEGALPLLAEAMHIGNPVARFLCVWQALAFHAGTDSPAKLDEIFFDRLGVPREPGGFNGPETKFTRFRNVLSHPRDRQATDYEGLDAGARALVDELARLVLQDLVARG